MVKHANMVFINEFCKNLCTFDIIKLISQKSFKQIYRDQQEGESPLSFPSKVSLKGIVTSASCTDKDIFFRY